MPKFILFGPPGIGKSTIIKELIRDGFPAADLEDLKVPQGTGLTELRYYELVKMLQATSKYPAVSNIFIGGAALDPSVNYGSDAFKILLVMPQAQYEERRAKRDEQQPNKKHQKDHKVSDWMKGVKYDYLLNVDQSIDKVLYDLYSFVLKATR